MLFDQKVQSRVQIWNVIERLYVACCLSLLVLFVSVTPLSLSLWKYGYCCPEARCELLTKCAVRTRELIEVFRRLRLPKFQLCKFEFGHIGIWSNDEIWRGKQSCLGE